MREQEIDLTRRVGLLHSRETNQPLGTCFALQRPGLFLTAAHVLRDTDDSSVQLEIKGSPLLDVARVERHPFADLAAVYLAPDANNPELEYFELGNPPEDATAFPLSESVLSYGYTLRRDEGTEDLAVDARLMRGCIQRHSLNVEEAGQHVDYELSFPSFPGNSGSPIMRDANRQEVIAVTTRGHIFLSRLGPTQTEACWTYAAALHSVPDWIRSI